MISRIPVTSARSLAEAYALLAERPPGLRVLAGGTDVMVQLNAGQGLDRVGHVLDIWSVPELRFVRRSGHSLSIGALTSYSELMRNTDVQLLCPALSEVSREVGAWAIQNRGTIGGNICNASPAGDTLPLLLAAGAVFHLGGPRGERSVPADEFFLGYRRTALGADELLLRIEIEVDHEFGHLLYRKVGTRRAQSISKTIIALRARGAESGGLAGVRIAAGCVAPIPLRCKHAEAALEGRTADEATLALVAAALQEDIAPIDDVRSNAEYRRRVSATVLTQLVRRLAGV